MLKLKGKELKESILLKEYFGEKVIHVLVMEGRLKTIPPRLLTEKVMLSKARGGYTPMHYVVMNPETMKELPAPLWKKKYLIEKNRSGESALQMAGRRATLNNIPLERIKEKLWEKEEIEELQKAIILQRKTGQTCPKAESLLAKLMNYGEMKKEEGIEM